jgi:F-type H+-transporting ATPase subunit gamma
VKGGKEIRQRLLAVKSTAKVTHAMQLVAASKMRRAQRMAVGGRRHALRLEELADSLLQMGDFANRPLCKWREERHRGIVVITTDKGLCGALNQNIFRLLPAAPEGAKFIAVGRKGSSHLAARRRDLLAEFSVNDNVPFFQVRPIANFLRDAFLRGEIDTVEIVHSVFVSTLEQRAEWIKLLPLANLTENLLHRLPADGSSLPADPRPLLVEPSRERVADCLLESLFRRELYHRLLESKAAEQSARTVAMKAATDNAEALAKDLRLEYNKIRQAAITEEILELTAAAGGQAQ